MSESKQKADWLVFQNFLEATGGVQGFLMLRQQEPEFCNAMLDAYGIVLPPPSNEMKPESYSLWASKRPIATQHVVKMFPLTNGTHAFAKGRCCNLRLWD